MVAQPSRSDPDFSPEVRGKILGANDRLHGKTLVNRPAFIPTKLPNSYQCERDGRFTAVPLMNSLSRWDSQARPTLRYAAAAFTDFLAFVVKP